MLIPLMHACMCRFDGVIGMLRFRLDKMAYGKGVDEYAYCHGAANCAIWDEFDVRYPLEGRIQHRSLAALSLVVCLKGDSNSLFLTTAVHLSSQMRESDTQNFIEYNKTDFRIAGVEDFWLKVFCTLLHSAVSGFVYPVVDKMIMC